MSAKSAVLSLPETGSWQQPTAKQDKSIVGNARQGRQLITVVQLPDDLKRVIDRQVINGHAASEAEFLAHAIQRYAEALEQDEDEIAAAADEGIADIEAGRFELIASPADMRRLRTELGARLDQRVEPRETSDR
jgi:Arc/MetJ-type ribon-helix-helix transcriptional regulator